jgi:protein-arginine kinase activator protein McsA
MKKERKNICNNCPNHSFNYKKSQLHPIQHLFWLPNSASNASTPTNTKTNRKKKTQINRNMQWKRKKQKVSNLGGNL